VGRACQRILSEQSNEGAAGLPLLAVLGKAQEEVYRDQIAAAAAASLGCFKSDGDL